ncbi:amidohydrolase family protein [Terricaulis sp.]|uniref:amidohydrolase family protein n=1 Tax=Terricaulis sp. TaxID=2768686 RepID=UPI0037835458
MVGALRSVLTLAVLLLASCATPARESGVTAFTHVAVITEYGGARLQDQTVLVRDDRIIAIGPAAAVSVPRGATVLGRRGQILAPGLTDMHVHIFNPDDGVLFLANGVTTVRNMSGRRDTEELAARIARGEAPGPTIYSSTPILDGPQTEYENPRAIRTPAEMRTRIDELAARGYVGVKLYENLSPATFRAGVEAARAHGLQVYAHVPSSMSLDDVLALHVNSVEHLIGFDRLLGSHSGWEEQRLADADLAGLPALAARVARSGVWNTATLVTSADPARAFADMDAAEAAPEYRFATRRLRAHWRQLYEAQRAERDPVAAWPVIERANGTRLEILRALRDAHAPLLIGTDAPQPFLYPGFSLHREFELHGEAGFTPAEILRIDTVESARFLNRDGEFGVIAIGARADLLLLDADPERDLAVLRAPAGVMAAGRWYDAATLQRKLDEIAGRVAEEVAAR